MSNQDPHTTPSAETRREEEIEAGAAHDPGRMPTADEEKAAPGQASTETAEHYEEMRRIGAEDRGEGQLP